jgi:hypothetical protein
VTNGGGAAVVREVDPENVAACVNVIWLMASEKYSLTSAYFSKSHKYTLQFYVKIPDTSLYTNWTVNMENVDLNLFKLLCEVWSALC